jgi:DedD protein
MENRNILLVVASVCLFLVIVVAAGLVLFWPQSQPAVETARVEAQPLFERSFDTFEFYKGTQEMPGLVEIEDTAQESLRRDLTITVGEAETVGEIEIEEKEADAAPRASTVPVVQRRRPTPETPAERTAAAKPSPKKIYVKEYEIQVGSYKTRSRAESVNRLLDELGLAGTIRTRDIEGSTYFRVRVGPYQNQDEAAKFLAWLKDVKGLEDSYISQVTRQKIIN